MTDSIDLAVPEALDLATRVSELRARRPTVGLAVGVVSDEGLESFQGRGIADLESKEPITEETVFRIASITKTFTAVAVMQLWEQGMVDLDAPANEFLRAFKLIPSDPAWRPATVRHLLTHTAGLGELAHPMGTFRPDFGESFEKGRPMPALADFYGDGLRLHAEPGTRFVYNNHGPSTLGQLVEDVSGKSLARYFSDHIFEPLGMGSSDLLRTELVESRLATGYEIRSNGVREVVERDMVTAGAASIYSTPRDMARYLAALLGGGGNGDGRILRSETMATMFEPHYQPDPRVPGMGLGFFRKRVGDIVAVGHQGTHPGFHSQILVAPDEGMGVMVFTNGARQSDFWLPSEAGHLLAELIGISDEPSRVNVPQHPEVWDDVSGWYRMPARLTDVRLRGMMGAGMEVFVEDGQLSLRFLTPIPALARGFPLLADDVDDPYAYRIEPFGPDEDPMRVVFARETDGTTRICFDIMPLVLRRQPPATNPRRWAKVAATALAAAVAGSAIRRVGRL